MLSKKGEKPILAFMQGFLAFSLKSKDFSHSLYLCKAQYY